MANYYPTPGIGFKRMLSKSFKIITVAEFKTSKLCCSCENETENPISRKNPKPYKDDIKTVHSLLRCKNVNCNKYYDRDVNGSKNILKLAFHHIKFGERKNTFVRQNEDEEKKPLNP
jgi:transposase